MLSRQGQTSAGQTDNAKPNRGNTWGEVEAGRWRDMEEKRRDREEKRRDREALRRGREGERHGGRNMEEKQ